MCSICYLLDYRNNIKVIDLTQMNDILNAITKHIAIDYLVIIIYLNDA